MPDKDYALASPTMSDTITVTIGDDGAAVITEPVLDLLMKGAGYYPAEQVADMDNDPDTTRTTGDPEDTGDLEDTGR